MLSFLLNVLRLVSWPNTWNIVEEVPSSTEKNVYSAGDGGVFSRFC